MNNFRKAQIGRQIAALRRENPSATHSFWFSQGQKDVSQRFDFERGKTTFNNSEYTEMIGFKFKKLSNWPDAVFLGVGSYSNVSREPQPATHPIFTEILSKI